MSGCLTLLPLASRRGLVLVLRGLVFGRHQDHLLGVHRLRWKKFMTGPCWVLLLSLRARLLV